ncbi:RtcB family protein [Patescibacteria group bacterium]|nr:RtcB family protein [Patescibacteria group bacterium]MBU1015811.1 RtcB family protein [Patescibacteria group bacterium]MBU1685230.1 RtcB family protein [Patescibacteria group bacterium]MBU1938239.1 RtcB family protein [Patescibacteria group bacterium]
MRVPARIFASPKLLETMDKGVYDQITNVATLPGIVEAACCMPDGHWGYGFPIGGVAAFDPDADGVILPGGIGFDINCGMRLITTSLTEKDVLPRLHDLIAHLYAKIPVGAGQHGFVRMDQGEFRQVLKKGAKWCLENGYAEEIDLEHTEDYGRFDWADPEKVTQRAISRGYNQIGTLGSGNHYLEIQVVRDKNIFDKKLANAFGVFGQDQIVIMFHCGSRGFGHQVATDYLQEFLRVMPKYGIHVTDRQLACAPFNSPEGRDYFAAMACAANMAFANRQVIYHQIQKCFSDIFGKSPRDLGMEQVYDISHNTAKLEKYMVKSKEKELLIHRKGATRSFPPGHPQLETGFMETGQPIIIGGSMETGSYLLAGTQEAIEKSWGSTAHGSGRLMSRHAAKRKVSGKDLQEEMEEKGILVKAASYSGLAEEAGFAYKDIHDVVEAVELSGISKKVAAFEPIGNIKG